MNDRQRLEAIVAVVCKYLPPDGISREEAMSQIIGLVDPLPAQPEQEPVAWMCENAVGYKYFRWKKPPNHFKSTPLYTAPPSKQWVGLTDAELAEFSDMKLGAYDLCLEVEAKLMEKNT